MTVKIALRLNGLDLRDITAYELIPEDLAEISFELHGGISLAVVYSEGPEPVCDAIEAARQIEKLVPSVRVVDVFDELVSVSDIAARCDVAAEAVRLWATGQRRARPRTFPQPQQVVGTATPGKTMPVYAWREVLAWVREVLHMDPDEGITYLDDRRIADLKSELANLTPAPPDATWHPMPSARDYAVFISHSRTSGADAHLVDALLSRVRGLRVDDDYLRQPRVSSRQAEPAQPVAGARQ
jgi:hypothetical protein